MKISMTTIYNITSISIAEVAQLMEVNKLHLFDCNSLSSYQRGHIPGARHLEPADYIESDLPSDKKELLVFYCSGLLCGASAYVARRAKKMGYSNVYVMNAGISGRIHSGRQTERQFISVTSQNHYKLS